MMPLLSSVERSSAARGRWRNARLGVFHPGAESDDFASPVHPQPGEAADRLAFDPVPLRYREDGLTPERQRAYVEALADTGVAREAAARVGLSEQAINRVRRRSDARSFDSACEAAHMFGARRLRSIAYERAVEGTLKGRYYHGELISEERVYDNRLLIYLLGKTAHLLDPPEESRAICDNWQAHMDALERGLPPPAAAPANQVEDESGDPLSTGEVWQEKDGSWRTTFPPPDGFKGKEEGLWNCMDWYCRTLSPEEQSALEALLGADGETPAQVRARECGRRDRFFGFAPGGDSLPGEAETNETSEEEEQNEGPVEYKSLVPPAPAGELPPLGNSVPLDPVSIRWRKSCIATSAAAELPPPLRFGKRPALRRHIQIPPPRHPC